MTGFTQNGRYLAWLVPGDDHVCETLVLRRVRTEAETRVSRPAGRLAGWCNGWEPADLVLAGERAYWTSASHSNTQRTFYLRTGSLDDRRIRHLAGQSIPHGRRSRHVAPASDGRSVYFWTSPSDNTPGPLARFGGLRRADVTETVHRLQAVAATAGRYAFAEARWSFDCAADPAWSPDGQRIVFARVGRRECRGGLWLIGADGTGERRIAATGRDPDWSPDGTRLAFAAEGAVWVSDADGRGGRVLVGDGSDPAWSPEGTQLAFVRGQSLYVIGVDGSGERQVVTSAEAPDWSPDGTRLVFARPSSLGGHDAIEVVNADGTARRTIASGLSVGEPAWSPDGRRIAFSTCEPACGASDGVGSIALAAPDGTAKGVAYRGRTHCATPRWSAWAPDSRRIAITLSGPCDDEGDRHLYTVAIGNSRNERQLTVTPPPKTTIELRTRAGTTLQRRTGPGLVEDLVVGGRVTAALFRGRRADRIEIYAPRRRTVRLRGSVSDLGAAGVTIIFRIGPEIYRLDARRGRPRLIAEARATPIGLSIVGRRVAWAENIRGKAYVRAVLVP